MNVLSSSAFLAAAVAAVVSSTDETRIARLNGAVGAVSDLLAPYDLTLAQVVYWASLATLAVLAARFLHGLLFSPLVRVRHLEEVGYLNHDKKNPLVLSGDVKKRRSRGNTPPPFPNGWFCLAYSREVGPKGVKNVEALGQHFAVFRGEDGRAHVLDAYCPHLGANLACGGKVIGDNLQCPFHGWEFHGDNGECQKVPYATSIPSQAKVKAWQCMEVNGQILVWFDAEGRDPLWTPPVMHGIENKTWTSRGYTQHTINAHIQEVPENGADVPHLNFLHTPVIAVGNDLRNCQTGFGPTMSWIQHTWEASWVPGKGDKSHVATLKLKHGLSMFGVELSPLNFYVTAFQVGPGLVYLTFKSFFGEGAFVQSLLPVGPMEQMIVHEVWGEWTLPTVIAKFFLQGEAIQVERDVMIWNNKKFNHKPMLTKSEGLILQFRRWYSQFYSEHSREVAEKSVNALDW